MLLFKDDTHEFQPILTEIEESPANPLAHATFFLIVITVVFFVAWSIIGEVDVVVTAPGKVIPNGHEKVVQTLESGIVSKICVKEGDAVKKGQVLIEIDSSVASDELTSLRKKCEQTQLEIERIRATLSGKQFDPKSVRTLTTEPSTVASQQQLFDSTTKLLSTQLREKEDELKQLEEQELQTESENEMFASLMAMTQAKEMRIKPLIGDGIPRDEWDKLEAEILTHKGKIQQNEHKLLEIAHKKSAIAEDIDKLQREFQTTHLNDLSTKLKEAADLQAQVKAMEFRTRKQVITAPASGYIDELFVHTLGAVVSPAEKLMTIIPSAGKCAIVTSVSNHDIGFVKMKMPVQIKVDTFDFQKYGSISGNVSLISFDSKTDEKSAAVRQQTENKIDQVFDVFIDPRTTELTVEGEKQKLKPGMTVVAEFDVGKRRIIEFFLYPLLKNWREGIAVR